ncbi:hypothetical protein Mapa_009851 [Marchantia paleacea]|nr:hypothetical protein Mapa_009851 [Marchantia paleacea]
MPDSVFRRRRGLMWPRKSCRDDSDLIRALRASFTFGEIRFSALEPLFFLINLQVWVHCRAKQLFVSPLCHDRILKSGDVDVFEQQTRPCMLSRVPADQPSDRPDHCQDKKHLRLFALAMCVQDRPPHHRR